MKLIGSLTSPFVRKVRVVMAEKKLDFPFELQDVWAEHALTEINPLGKVPCLLMDGGESIYDSRVIVEYLDTLSPVSRLLPERGRERAEVLTWEALADGLLDAAILARLENTWSGRTEAQRCPAWVDRQLNKVHSGLKALSQGLGDRPWLAGQHMSLADIATGCALGWLEFRFPDILWRDTHPGLARFFDKLNSRTSFIDTAPPKASLVNR